jgi:hypothetical protein
MTIATTHDPRELAHRSSDGIEVWLFWSPDDDRLFVRCVDGRVEDAFELDTAPRMRSTPSSTPTRTRRSAASTTACRRRKRRASPA